MSAREERDAERATSRLEHYGPLVDAAPSAKHAYAAASDWFRAAVRSERTIRAAASELARLARRADEHASARLSGGV